MFAGAPRASSSASCSLNSQQMDGDGNDSGENDFSSVLKKSTILSRRERIQACRYIL